MEVTLEMVERLREKAPVTYAQARQALEYSGGNLLDALIYLEEQGAIPREEGAYFSTRNEASPPPPKEDPLPVPMKGKETRNEKKRHLFNGIRVAVVPPKGEGKRWLSTLRRWLIDNELEIWRRDQPVTALPVLILVLLLVFVYWLMIPALILGLFLGFRYRFSGPDLERDDLNDMMGSVADTASDLGRQVMDELRSQHEKHEKEKHQDGKKP